MKKYLLLCLLLLASSCLFATDTLYFRLSNPWNTVKDPSGPYVRKAVLNDSGYLGLDYNAKGILVVRGYYTDTNFNRKLYTHFYFNQENGYKEEVRTYANGRLNGIKAGFNEGGDTLWRETIVENAITDTKDFPGYNPKPVTFTAVEKVAVFPGGKAAWMRYLNQNLKYPKQASKQKIEGTVKVSFVVSGEGKITNVSVAESVHPLLDAEAVRLIQASPRWEPAVQNGKKVIYMIEQGIGFKL